MKDRNVFIATQATVLSVALIAASRIRKRFRALNSELGGLAADIDDLARELDMPSANAMAGGKGARAGAVWSSNGLDGLGSRIRAIREGLRAHVNRINAQDNSMITALASDYHSVYYVDLDADEGMCYRQHYHVEDGLREGERFVFSEVIDQYTHAHVAPDFREGFLRFFSPEAIREELAHEVVASYRYLAQRDGRERFETVRIAGVRRPEDRDDHIVHAIGVGLADADRETREALARNKALHDALIVAEEANKAKTAFLSNMSHEMRTPMNAIIGLSTVALGESDVPERTRDHLEKISTSAQHLLDIINDVLDMSRIEAGRAALKAEEFSLVALLDQVNAIAGGQSSDKGVSYRCDIADRAGDFYIGDDAKLRQVLVNMLGNAVKFTPPGGSVELRVERVAHYDGKSTLRFAVSDTGIGMDPEFATRVFEAFSQEDASSTTEYGSTGLGMAITKSLVEMMNGEIEVESEKGVGTTFTATVTLADLEEPKAPEEPKEADGADKAEAGDGQALPTLQGRRILLAEDMDVNAEIITMVLQMRDMEVERAENGKIAFEMFAEHPAGHYDAVLMDMRMPEMDGLEATAAIRALDRADAKTIPIIALTANAFEEDVQKSLQAGLDAHLTKPVEPEVLFATLAGLV